MRVIAGRFGGRRLLTPKDQKIRPTSDKIRGAIFNMLHSMGALEDARVLDGFCGTGALGIEALSRGAVSCCFVDKSRTSLALTKENIEAVGAAGQAVFQCKDLNASLAWAGVSPFSLVFLDPPYNEDLVSPALKGLLAVGALNNDTVCIVESEVGFNVDQGGSFAVQREKIYGDTKISVLRYSQ